MNWVLREDKVKVNSLENDLKDGIVLIKLAQRLTGKETKQKYSLSPKSIHQKRDNLRVGLELLRKNGFSKEASSVSEEDFEKDEEGNTQNIDTVPVLGFLWQLVNTFSKTHIFLICQHSK